jgi:predicted negative regulator of RcsB-dependent stress response
MATLTHQPTDSDAMSMDDDPQASFQSLAAEGDILAKQGDFRKAADAYSKASIPSPILMKSGVGY